MDEVQPSDEVTEKTDQEWRRELTPEQYEVLRRKGTEPPFSGSLLYNKSSGMYRCAACGADLFGSREKFDSGTGWPSFTAPAVADNVRTVDDFSHGMHRVEVTCARCGGHLGHVFPDGPGPSAERYCINSLALDFAGDEENHQMPVERPSPRPERKGGEDSPSIT